jgi:predicted acyl esterase
LPWRRSYDLNAQALVPGKPVEMVFDLLPTAYVVPAVHRIQLSVVGSDWRESDRHWPAARLQITVLADAQHRSRVDLPLAPYVARIEWKISGG